MTNARISTNQEDKASVGDIGNGGLENRGNGSLENRGNGSIERGENVELSSGVYPLYKYENLQMNKLLVYAMFTYSAYVYIIFTYFNTFCRSISASRQ